MGEEEEEIVERSQQRRNARLKLLVAGERVIRLALLIAVALLIRAFVSPKTRASGKIKLTNAKVEVVTNKRMQLKNCIQRVAMLSIAMPLILILVFVNP